MREANRTAGLAVCKQSLWINSRTASGGDGLDCGDCQSRIPVEMQWKVSSTVWEMPLWTED